MTVRRCWICLGQLCSMMWLLVSPHSNEHITLPPPSSPYAQKDEQYSREAVPPLANARHSQQLREAQTRKDPQEQLIWKGVPGNTCEEAEQGFHQRVLPCRSCGVPPSIYQREFQPNRILQTPIDISVLHTGLHCGGLNEIVPYTLGHLNSWLQVGGAIWVGLGDVTLLEVRY